MKDPQHAGLWDASRPIARLVTVIIAIAACLSGCKPADASVTLSSRIGVDATPAATQMSVAMHSPTSVATQTPEMSLLSPTSTPATPDPATDPAPSSEPSAEICSPLEAIPIEALLEIISNPYEPSRTGKDDGHPALDLAFYHWRGLKDIAGHPVLAVMDGSVAAVGFNRLPYGNMVIIETPWESAPAAARLLPGAGAGRSFYVLYAHLQDVPERMLGESVSCGHALGNAGQTGRSGAPHLHLEARLGPPGTQFSPMVFYDTQASTEQMDSYRLWTMSGVFESIEPLALLGLMESP